jgi:hypothetical protein
VGGCARTSEHKRQCDQFLTEKHGTRDAREEERDAEVERVDLRQHLRHPLARSLVSPERTHPNEMTTVVLPIALQVGA